MYKRKFFHMIILIVGLVVLFSCEYEKIYFDAPDPSVPVSYAADIQTIWDGGCTGCHGVGKTPPDLTAANSYDNLINGGYVNIDQPDQSKIYTEMATGGGMAPYTNATNTAKVLLWIQQGAKNN